jgi:hypothetical protein
VFGQTPHLFGANNVKVKQKISKITVDKNFIDTFSFSKQWAYPDYTFKDDSGHFEIDEDREITAEDTAHLYFTANCTTNVQGGYDIRYCFAKKKKNEIVLTFSDGLPAYASQFYVHIDTSTFWCDAETIYPVIAIGQKKFCRIIKQKITVDKSKYSKGDTIKGFIEIDFIETVSVPKKGVQKRNLFLKGYFKTPLTE